MAAEVITCPKCYTKIPLTEALTNQIREGLRKELSSEIERIKQDYKHELEDEREKIRVTEKEKAEQRLQVDLEDLRQQISEKNQKIEQANKKELDFRKKTRDLEEKEKTIELEIQKRIDEERQKICDDSIRTFQETFRLQLAEKEKTIIGLSKNVDELQRKISQGSQQLQGEVPELELEQLLRDLFPQDKIEPIAKGARGADIIQKVFYNGVYCGSILWESKRAKSWAKDWVHKLKADQVEAKADIAVLSSTVFPKDLDSFGFYEGVWVTDFNSISGLAMALRSNLIDVARERVISSGRNDKMEILYTYINGPEFRRKVQSIADSIVAMQEDLNKEKRAIEKLWAKREKQIQTVAINTIRMIGEMEGITGKSLKETDSFELLDEGSE